MAETTQDVVSVEADAPPPCYKGPSRGKVPNILRGFALPLETGDVWFRKCVKNYLTQRFGPLHFVINVSEHFIANVDTIMLHWASEPRSEFVVSTNVSNNEGLRLEEAMEC
jgi:hypothetical protein